MNPLKKIKRWLIRKNPLTRNLYILYYKKIIAELKPGELGVIGSHNLGETYYFCTMLDAFKQRHHIRKIVMLGPQKYHSAVFDMFPAAVERYCICPAIKLQPFRTFQTIKPGSLYFFQCKAYWKCLDSDQPAQAHFLAHLRHTLGLTPDTPIRHPEIPEQRKIEAKMLFDRLGLTPGKTVLLAPEARSCPPLEHDFCQTLCEGLKRKGFDVFLNTTHPRNAFPAAAAAFLPLPLAAPFTALCGHVIAVRSGFCDIISSAPAAFHILYPSSVFQRFFTMKDILPPDSLNEYILENTPSRSFIETILNRF